MPPSHHTNDSAASCGIDVSKKVEVDVGAESHAAQMRSEASFATGRLKFKPLMIGTVNRFVDVDESVEVQCKAFG